MAQVHGKAGEATYHKGDRLLHSALVPMLSMGFLIYVFFRLKGGPTMLLQIIVGFVILGVGLRCARNIFGLEVAADRYYGGAGGEQDVGLVLSRLPDEFHVFNGLGFDAGDVDHVVIGPTGVFIIETKSHAGTISQHDGHLCRNGVPLTRDFVRQALSEAMYVKRRLSPRVPCHVRPFIVFARAKVRVRTSVDGVRVVPLASLVDVIRKRGACLSPAEIGMYVARLGLAGESAACGEGSSEQYELPSGPSCVHIVGAAYPGFIQLAAPDTSVSQVQERIPARP